MVDDLKFCSQCVLPNAPPDILIGDDGLCPFCRTDNLKNASENSSSLDTVAGKSDITSNSTSSGLLETDFMRMIEKFRGKGEYDCLVMLSGGKDSTASLYYMVRRYGMKPLAFTFDHGFETNEALSNIKKATSKLGVDHMLFSSGGLKPVLKQLLKEDSSAVICHVCSIWYMDLTFKISSRFDTPLIIAGWTKGQASVSGSNKVMNKCACNADAPEYRSMGKATADFVKRLKNIQGLEDFPSSMEEVIARASKRSALFFGKRRPEVLSPHWFLPQSEEEYINLIKKELDWIQPKVSYPEGSTNCLLNFMAVERSMRFWGYTHYHVELSKMIRAGLITREEALKRLDTNFDSSLMDEINKRID